MDINYNKVIENTKESYKNKRENISKLEPIMEIDENDTQKSKLKNKNVICANCGEKGHVVKDCTGPITSFGIIAFKAVFNKDQEKYDKNHKLQDILHEIKELKRGQAKHSEFIFKRESYPKIKFLMIQRKDTMGYIDFIRGKYSNTDEDEKMKKINICLSEMTFKEKESLLTQDFDQIWNNLWVNHDSKCYKNEYETAKKKFNQLDVKKLVTESQTKYSFQEFGFAKGRRNMKETNISCAEREFYEETRYNKASYEFINDYPQIYEEFVGTNGINYRHIYYLVKMKSCICPPKIDLTNKIQAGEVKNIGWFTFDECNLLLRPYDTAKKEVLKNVYNDILKMNFNFKCHSSNGFRNFKNNNTFQKKPQMKDIKFKSHSVYQNQNNLGTGHIYTKNDILYQSIESDNAKSFIKLQTSSYISNKTENFDKEYHSEEILDKKTGLHHKVFYSQVYNQVYNQGYGKGYNHEYSPYQHQYSYNQLVDHNIEKKDESNNMYNFVQTKNAAVQTLQDSNNKFKKDLGINVNLL